MNANEDISTGKIILYQPDNTIRLEVRVEDETVWLNQAQMAILFGRNQSVISRHIANIFSDGELEEKSNMHFLHIAHADRPTAIYNLDVIISVGYRVKSKQGIQFRQWASRVLKESTKTPVCNSNLSMKHWPSCRSEKKNRTHRAG